MAKKDNYPSFSTINYALAKGYVKKTLVGTGALKGSPCTIEKTEDVPTGTKITFRWDATDGTVQRQPVIVNDGVGIFGIEKVSTVENVDTYRITFTDATYFDFTVTNGTDKTKLSEFENDTHFVDKTVDKLDNFYNKQEVEAKIDNIIGGHAFKIVEELPKEQIDEAMCYLILEDSEDTDVYSMHMYIDGEWADLGTTEDLKPATAEDITNITNGIWPN